MNCSVANTLSIALKRSVDSYLIDLHGFTRYTFSNVPKAFTATMCSCLVSTFLGMCSIKRHDYAYCFTIIYLY